MLPSDIDSSLLRSLGMIRRRPSVLDDAQSLLVQNVDAEPFIALASLFAVAGCAVHHPMQCVGTPTTQLP